MRIMKLTLVVTALQCAVLALCAKPAITFLFGDKYVEAGQYLQILLIGSVL